MMIIEANVGTCIIFETFIYFKEVNLNCCMSKKVPENFLIGLKFGEVAG